MTLFASSNQSIIAGNAAPANNLRQLIAWLKSNGGKVTCGAAGQVDILFDQVSSPFPQVRAGKIEAFAVQIKANGGGNSERR